jgi:glycolate oxidase iron-sulfur subunit
MNSQDICKEFEKEIVKCSRCGNCRTICPVSLAENEENTTARSKVRMLEAVLDGELEMTLGVQARFDKCLLCKACKTNCGSSVDTGELIMGARTHLVMRHGVNPVKRMAFTGLRYRKLFDFGLRSGAFFQKIIFKDSADGQGKVARIPIPAAGLNLRRVVPNLTTRPLRTRLPEFIKAETPLSKGRVVFFTGCTLNYMYPQAGEAVVKVLTQNGWDVIIPEKQCCCGTPAFTSGDAETGKILAEQNVSAVNAQECDYVLTACSSCGAALQTEYGHLLAESPMLGEWKKLSPKVIDIAQFVVKHCDMSKFGKLPMKITYHDPCHLVRGMNVTAEPRQIFRSIPGVEYVEMKDADRCCGAGGTFSAVYYELSRRINDKKLDNVEATGMEYVVTGCSACRMHISDGLSQRNSQVKVLHTAEVVALAFDAGKKEEKAC